MTKGIKEDAVLRSCMDYLSARGIFHWRQNSGAFRTQKGFFRCCSINGVSDILGVLPDGRFLAVECKREKGGRLSPEQADFLETVRLNGGVAIVANSAGALAEEMKRRGY